ncbi:MAG: hypothetical protein HC911_14360 [Chloroflexaceae bacterium]|nr:hypothetical protein [Chloroflexaceae bacterium]
MSTIQPPSQNQIYGSSQRVYPQQLFRAALAQFGQHAGIQCTLLMDLSGQVLGSYYPASDLKMNDVASVSIGEWAAANTLASLSRVTQRCRFITQEHDTFRLLLAAVGDDMVLMTVTANDVPVGWTRLQMQRLAELCLKVAAATYSGREPLVRSAAPVSHVA